MRRLSEEQPDSPVIEIRERQWALRNWLLGALTLGVLALFGLVYAGIRINETREQRNQAVAKGEVGPVVSQLRDVLLRVEERTSDSRIAGIATSAVEEKVAEASARVAGLRGQLAAIEDTQQRLFGTLATLQDLTDSLGRENQELRAELAGSNDRIVALQLQRLVDSTALAEQNSSLDRRLRGVADHTSDVDARVGRSNRSLRGFGSMSVANVAISLIHLLGTKQASDVRPESATIGR